MEKEVSSAGSLPKCSQTSSDRGEARGLELWPGAEWAVTSSITAFVRAVLEGA